MIELARIDLRGTDSFAEVRRKTRLATQNLGFSDVDAGRLGVAWSQMIRSAGAVVSGSYFTIHLQPDHAPSELIFSLVGDDLSAVSVSLIQPFFDSTQAVQSTDGETHIQAVKALPPGHPQLTANFIAVQRELLGKKTIVELTDELTAKNAELEQHQANLEETITERTAELSESEARFKSVIDQLPVAISLKDLQGRYQLANRRFHEWFVADGIDVVGKNTFDVYADDIARDFLKVDKQILETGEALEVEVIEPFADGQDHMILMTKFPIRDEDGNTISIGAVEADITERKQSEEALAAKESQLRAALDNMSDGLMLLDKDLRYQLYNSRYVELVGLPAHLIEVGKPLRAVLQEAANLGFYGDGDCEEQVNTRMAAYESDQYVEAEIATPQNRVLTVRKNALENGGAVAMFSDITDRKRTEEEIRQSQDRMEKILEVSPAAVAIVTQDGSIKMTNPRFSELFGFARDDMIDENIVEFYREPEQRAGIVETLERDKIVSEQLIEYVRRDGSEFEVYLTMVTIEFPEGQRNIAWLYDVTELRSIQKELAEAKELAEQAAEAKANFLATMSHEIRTPMNGVMSMAEILDQSQLSADQRSMTRTIRQSGEALLTVINDILDFSKIEAGKLDIETIPFDLVDVIESTADLLAPRAEEKSLDLLVDVDSTLPRELSGDPNRVRQLLLNLGSNAIKFTEEGIVEFKARRVDGDGQVRVRFEIVDSGIGLTLEQQGKLFQAFTQADSTTSRKFGGTGLGLSICKRLCELMDGEIDVESKPGEGSTFWFELPFEANELEPAAPEHDLSAARALLIGYGKREADILGAYLRQGGVTAIAQGLTAFSNKPVLATALKKLKNQPDLILLNGKPGLHGCAEVIARLSELAPSKDCPIIVTAPHGAVSTLNAGSLKGQGVNFLATMTCPTKIRRLWHLVAVALEKADLDEYENSDVAARHDYLAPDIETARASNAVILVAEDNETNQIVIRRVLSRLGYAHEIAPDGAEALKLYQSHPYGLLLTDFHMPDMDGFELTAAIRAGELKQDNGVRLPIIAITADALPETEQQCLDAGMDGYLRKPLEMARLEALLETYLPQALELRSVLLAEPVTANTAPSQAADGPPPFDPEIFDPAQLEDSFGPFDATTAEFLMGFLPSLKERISELEAALAQSDVLAARELSHAMKGAANSAGARRMGQIMGDIQDSLDGDDQETAMLFGQLLQQTYEELNEVVEPLCRRFMS